DRADGGGGDAGRALGHAVPLDAGSTGGHSREPRAGGRVHPILFRIGPGLPDGPRTGFHRDGGGCLGVQDRDAASRHPLRPPSPTFDQRTPALPLPAPALRILSRAEPVATRAKRALRGRPAAQWLDPAALADARAGYRGRRDGRAGVLVRPANGRRHRRSTRLNSSHVKISYAVFCLKKKKKKHNTKQKYTTKQVTG